MTRRTMAAMVIAGFVFAAAAALTINRAAEAGDRPSLAGRWTLNRQMSQFPSDLGFGMDLMEGSGSDTGGGRGRASGGSGILAATFQESQDEARRRELLVEEAKNPSSHLTISQTETAVTVTDEGGRSRTFHPNGKQEVQALAPELPVTTTTRWDGTRLEVRYKVERYRELLYTYSRTLDPPRLVVQIRFVERGGHDTVTRTYEPTSAHEPAVPARAPSPAEAPRTTTSGAAAATPPAPATSAAGSDVGKPPVPATSGGAAPVVVAGPDAELKGLAQIGVVVEDLSSQAGTCGLTQAPIEAALSKSLSDAGLKVLRNSDEDTYVYVNINTSSVSPSLCVSRYDAFLYSYTTATLPYQKTPVLAQVTLLHKSGIAGGAPAAHADAGMRSVKQYVDEFARRIRDANQR
jgi:hypothetical protein